ncbi:MAG: FAD:protein FMN transferase [Firmicutes bacterium]|nr:FAD:protein FMN transferase [Bacillota bacterium]
MKKTYFILAVIFSVALAITYAVFINKEYEANGFAMGTLISQKIYGIASRKAANEAFEKIKYLECLMTINAPGGDINRLNENAGKGYIKLNPETISVLKSALIISRLSGGAFDITVAPVVKEWGIGSVSPRIPPKKTLIRLGSLIGYKNVYIDEKNQGAALAGAGQMVDLGGIAKGYAADAVIQIYRRNGIRSGLINIGGNVATLGTRPDGTPWRIGIQDPRARHGKILGVVRVSDQAVVTSGDYEKYFMKNGKRYHHIINPRSGRPAESGLISVTIVAASSTEADALATAVFILGSDKGMSLLKRYGRAEAILITANKKLYITPGLKKDFEFMNNGSKEYEYVEKR